MGNVVTSKLNIEIEKLKAQDYTSYQKFYNETSKYLYEIIYSNVQDQNIANEIINDLYTDIYSSIGTELTDNSQFYTWAGNKAQVISTTYLTTHNIEGVNGTFDKERKAEDAAVIAATNAGINSMSSTAGVSTAGVGTVGMDAAAGGAGQVGMGSVAGGATQAGFGSVAAGMEQYAAGTGMASGMASGNIGAGMATGAAKTGLSLGAKIAIGVVAGVAVVGAGVGAFFASNSHKDKEKTTETKIEAIVSEEQTDVGTEIDDTEIVTEETTEELYPGDMKERYTAYYEVLKPYIEHYQTVLIHELNNDGGQYVEGLQYVNLTDLNADGNEELIVLYNDAYETGSLAMMDIYDYTDGSAKLVSSIEVGYWDTLELKVAEDGKQFIWLTYDNYMGAMGYDIYYTRVDYIDENTINVSEYYYNIFGAYYYVNGSETDEATFNQAVADAGQENEAIEVMDSGDSNCMLTKHITINKLAQISGDSTYDGDEEITYTRNEEDAYIEGNVNIEYVSNVNIYNEIYEIHFTGSTDGNSRVEEISASGKSIHLVDSRTPYQPGTHAEVVSYGQDAIDYYLTYKEGTLVIIGHVDNFVSQDGPVRFWDGEEVTEEEYNAYGSQLMSE